LDKFNLVTHSKDYTKKEGVKNKMSETQAEYKVPTLTKEQIQAQIAYLAKMELVRSYEIGNSRFNSAHEGYAVIKEEVEETADEGNGLVEQVEILWSAIKQDKHDFAECTARDIYQTALAVAYEAIQAAAMARKYLDSLGRGVTWGDILGDEDGEDLPEFDNHEYFPTAKEGE
jgi:hypothetical protein